MKNKLLSIFISLFILSFSILFIFLPKKEFSELEFRYLQKLPKFSFNELVSGEYIEDLESYLTDHFPLRDIFMSIKTKYQLLIGQRLINGVYVGDDEYLFQEYNKPVNTDRLINKLNEFYNKNNVDMSIMLVPSSGVINSDKLPNNVSLNKQLDTIDYIYDNLKFENINITNKLIEGNKKYQMYYKLDHHWTSYGAYYAYLEYCNINNINPVAINDFDIKTITDSFNGTLYSKVNIYSYNSDKIDVFNYNNDIKVNYVASNKEVDTLYEEKHLNTKDKYSYFLDGNHPLIQITNESELGEILVIKDSYANSFIPFLVNHYNKVHVIDLRFYNASVTEYIKTNNIDKVLFLYNINDIDNDTGIYKIN
ncbi:MAG: hypothetical protein E7170_04435 [Firmicutes bacterium]|nr:hypothetical protein [Bacillota bacterium]